MHDLVFAALCLAVTATTPSSSGDWPQFRGPSGQGMAESAPMAWSEESGVRWKTALPGRGWSSPVVADRQIWVTTATEQEPTAEQVAKVRDKFHGTPNANSMNTVASIDLWAIQLDAATGDIVREVKLFHIDDPDPIHGLNSYASPSPVLADGRCYCHFGSFGTACVDCTSGEVVWRNALSLEHMVGPGSSPVVHDDLLIIPCDGCDRQFVAALHLATGKTAWKTPRPPIRKEDGDLRKAFCTPLVIEVDGVEQAVIPGAQWFIAYDPHTGKELWRVDHGSGFSNVPRPVFDGQNVFLCTGFGPTELWAVDPRGRGDVSATHVAWKATGKRIPTQPSPALVDGRLYLVNDTGVASCYDATSGELVWIKRVSGNFSASPLAADGRVYFCNREGITTIVEAGDKYVELAKNRLDGSIMASPAATDGDLLLRTDTHLYRINGE